MTRSLLGRKTTKFTDKKFHFYILSIKLQIYKTFYTNKIKTPKSSNTEQSTNLVNVDRLQWLFPPNVQRWRCIDQRSLRSV